MTIAIQFTPAAAAEVHRLRSRQQPETPAQNIRLRLRLRPGGCQSLTYDLAFEPTPPQLAATPAAGQNQLDISPVDNGQEDDSQTVRAIQGSIEVIANRQDWPHLNGLIIDYSEDLMGGGFHFQNPNAATICQCSHSFTAIQD